VSSTRRTAILDAAARVIRTRGFTHTSVEDLIQATGLSGKSHFYHYFPSKEALGMAVIDRQFDGSPSAGWRS
jgi:TetR/AcrR family transcriptional repressor of nem operon